MCRFGVVAVLAGVLFAAACAASDERHAEQMMLGQQYYNNGKFYEAIGRFTAAAEHAGTSRETYQATLGVANASAEYGLILYEYAQQLLRDGKRSAGMTKWQEADKWHEDSARAFYKCLEMRPDDTIANKGLGDLFYRRSTSFSVLPYTETKEGVALRQKERDEAVRQYGIVLAAERGDITLPGHGPTCQSPHIHRYLALALLTRSDWDKNDGEEARRHMMVYLNYLRWALQSITTGMVTGPDEALKLDKEKRMDHLRRQITETRSLLSTQLKGLEELVLSWRAGNEKPPIPAEKREAWILAAHREIIALKELAQAFEDAAAASRKKPKDKEKTEAVKNN